LIWDLLLNLKISHRIALITLFLTILAYITLFTLGRRWRRVFEAKNITYWKGSKKERIEELLAEVWEPRKIAALYGLAYFIEGYVRTSISLWVPFFLLQVRGINSSDTALFLGLMYAAWSWRTFIGMASDAIPIPWRGRRYRRLPWFILSGLLSICTSIPFIFTAPEEMSIWTVFFPAVTAMITADAILDVAADSYALDVTPPDFHSRVLGGASFFSRGLGAALACILPPILISMGGYRLTFIMTGLIGSLVIFCVVLKEPKLEHERIFSRQAIAFTFTEKSVLIAAIMMAIGISPRTFSDVIGGIQIGLIATVMASIGSLSGGWAADRWGHKRMFLIFRFVNAVIGLLWIFVSGGMVGLFIAIVMIANILGSFGTGGMMGILSDVTPLGLASTVFQMYMSLAHVAKIITAIIISILLPQSLQMTMIVLSLLSLLSLIPAFYIKPYEAGKADKV
jgi:MFS family permease